MSNSVKKKVNFINSSQNEGVSHLCKTLGVGHLSETARQKSEKIVRLSDKIVDILATNV
jgi:hypothetical protein